MIISGGEALVDMVPHAVAGGGPMNVAIAAARLGVPAAFVGAVSNDAHGDLIWEHLQASGVDLRAAQRRPEPTARAIVEREPKLSFRFEGDGTADTCLVDVDLGVLGDGPALFHGGTLGLFRGQTAETLAGLAEAHRGIVSLDPNIRPDMIDDRERWEHFHQRWLTNTSVYKASDEDLDWIWPNRTTDSVAEELVSAGMGVFIMTRGPEGAHFYTPSGEVSVEGVQVDVVDTVGAGDTFVASMLTSLWNREIATPGAMLGLGSQDWVEMGRDAVRCAAITCSRQGANPPTAAELAAFGGDSPSAS